jgi:hypothetical protein
MKKNLSFPSKWEKELKKVKKIKEPFKKKIWVLGIITEVLQKYGIKPVLIGGGALEWYTLGGYTTNDLDIAVSDHLLLDKAMKLLGFKKEGRYWFRKDLEVVVESPAAEVFGNAPLTEVRIENFSCFIIGIEDLIIDRLNGFVHWHWEDDGRWAKRLIFLHQDKIDWNYLQKKARQEKVLRALNRIKKEIEKNETSESN